MVDLRNPRKTISLFGNEEVARIIRDIAFLEKLSDDLSRPFQPRKAHLEYLPTQFLCEFIKKLGYSGVIYRSSVGPMDGTNYAFFEETDFSCSRTESLTVTKVDVSASKSM